MTRKDRLAARSEAAAGAAPLGDRGESSTEEDKPPSRGALTLAVPLETDDDPVRSRARLEAVKQTNGIIVNQRAKAFYQRFFPDSTRADWNDWRWQLRHRVTGPGRLDPMIRLTPEEAQAFSGGERRLPMAVTPYYLSLIDPDDPGHPIRRCVVPVTAESVVGPGEADDPLGESADEVAPGLVHRYPDRVLLLVTRFCSTYCRYCTRSRLVGGHGGGHSGRRRLEAALAYIEATPQIRDVVVSGGDPLTLSNRNLEWILARLRQIKHVEIIRLGTKVPAVLPQRITTGLVRMLKRYHPLFMSLHFTHPLELTPEAAAACARLANAGIPLGSQTVLLAGVNDDVATMAELMRGLLRMRVRPYYLYQCDPISGSAHFRTAVAKGLEIIQGLRGHISGYAVPTYVIDAPGGGGKVALCPEAVAGRDGGNLILRNFRDDLYLYPDTGAGCS